MIRFVAALIDNETTGAVPFVTFCANRLPNPSYVQLRPHSGPVVANRFRPCFSYRPGSLRASLLPWHRLMGRANRYLGLLIAAHVNRLAVP